MTPRKVPFVLASASPRRQELLEKAGYRFRVVPSEVDEAAVNAAGLEAREVAERLALAKAEDVARRLPDDLVLGADTVVDWRGQVIGKPADAADAERITRMLFSEPHRVITGVALVRLRRGVRQVIADVTTVYPARLTEEQIAEHIRSGNWQGKAGAYGIQETGDTFVDHIEGSFTNVMGLPMERIDELLGLIIDA